MSTATRSIGSIASVKTFAWADDDQGRRWQTTTRRRRQGASQSRQSESNGDELVVQCKSIQTSWTLRERDARRRQALRKQEELLMLLAGDDLESIVRGAVADAELPVVLPEIAALQAG